MTYSNTTGLPSVTTIINKVFSAWLPTDFYTEESRLRGSAVHAWCAQYALGEFALPLKKEWQGYCQSFARWADRYLVKAVVVEQRFTSAYGYSGQIDLFMEMKGRKGYGLLDIKTGAKEKWHPIQLAAYRRMLIEHDLIPQWWATIRLNSDGELLPMLDFYQDYTGDLNIFLSCLNAFRFMEQ